MKKDFISLVFLLIFSNTVSVAASDELIIPESSQLKENRAVTSLILTKPKNKLANGLPDGETPASLACIYGLTPHTPGCNKNIATQTPKGGWGAIALVDAFHNPYAEHDLGIFSAQFNLSQCTIANGCFHVYYATPPNYCNNVNPPSKHGWWDEQVLDIEMAHAMAPNAKIYLVEANSDSIEDLLLAEDCASSLVARTGGVVSNSWSFPESPQDPSYNYHFTTPGIVYLGSSGDYGAPARYPSSSPNVVSAGGTHIIRDSKGNFVREEAWSRVPGTPPNEKSGSSGGPSHYQSRPSYQNIVQKIVGSHRGTPDIAFDADVHSGELIYSTHSGGWIVSGGTSAASPALAGIINTANHRATSSFDELSFIYSFYPKKYHEYWHDITSGNNGYPALLGYDFITGLGSPLSYAGK